MATAEELNKTGMEAYKAGDLAGAIRAYEQAIVLKPDYPPCLINMSVALLKQGKAQPALDALHDRVAQRPCDGTVCREGH